MSVNDRRRTIVGVCLTAFTVYMAFAFLSYLFTWRIDQSTLDVPIGKLFSNTNIEASNWTGTFGALLAQRFMYKWIGLPSFGLIVLLTVCILRLFKIKAWPIGRTAKLTIVYAIWVFIYVFPPVAILAVFPVYCVAWCVAAFGFAFEQTPLAAAVESCFCHRYKCGRSESEAFDGVLVFAHCELSPVDCSML